MDRYPGGHGCPGKSAGLAYDFNHTRPDEKEKRMALLPEIFGSVGKDVWIEPPLTLAFGKRFPSETTHTSTPI
ncbi:MAG: maltose acetyltransferase domain-containing protein [Blautia marasmi]